MHDYLARKQALIHQKAIEGWREYAAKLQTLREYVTLVEEGKIPLVDSLLEEAHAVLAGAAEVPLFVSKVSFESSHTSSP